VNNNVNGHRVALLRFDLSTITAPITNLRLDLTGSGFYTGKPLNIYGVINNEDWAETTATWANAPGVNHAWTGQTGGLADYLNAGELYGGGAILAKFTPAMGSGTLAAFDAGSGPVLDFVNADADKIVTFLIAEDDPSDSPGTTFSTRETPAQAPLLTVSCVPTTTAPAVIRVLLLGGQSNAIGQASAATLSPTLLAPQTDVLLYSYVSGQPANADGTLGGLQTLHAGAAAILGNFGPEVTLGQALSPLLTTEPGTKLAIIKFAKGGTSLNFDWRPDGTGAMTGDGPLYQTFQQVVSAGLAKLAATYPTSRIQLDGMVWVQGEQDTNTEANAQGYGALLTSFISDVRTTFSPGLPFFLSRLSLQQTYYSSTRYPAFMAVRQGQQSVAASVAGTYLLDIDAPAFSVGSDKVHFDAAGQQALGNAFAARVAGILNPQTLVKNDGGTQTLTGFQNYGTITANSGVLTVNGTIGSGTSAVVVNNAGTQVIFGASQTLGSLVIGAGAAVTLTSGTSSTTSGSLNAPEEKAAPLGSLTAAAFVEVPLVAAIAPGPSGMKITWNAIPGHSYSIQTSPDLVTWSPPFSVGEVGQWTDADLGEAGARFYRVLRN
jgi:hypothetical protein